MYKHILCPIDILEEELIEKTIPHIEFLAKQSNATVTLVNVLAISTAIVNAYSFGFEELQSKATAEAITRLKQIAAKIDIPSDRIHVTTACGSPRDEILTLADDIKADLIIIGSRRPNITTHLLGSNSGSIIRQAKTNVLVVR